MSSSDPDHNPARLRREPPQFRRVTVIRVEPVTPRLVRITLAGPELAGFTVDEPAASVRLLIPPAATGAVVIPAWNGNEFLYTDGRRPAIRTFTPLRVDADSLAFDIEAVIHGEGAAARWAAAAEPGAAAAVSGPGRGYTVDPDAPAFLLGGDESAIPAISQLLDVLPVGTPTRVHIEVAQPDARVSLPVREYTTVEWHDLPGGAPPGTALVAAICDAELAPGTRVWVAGEAAAVQRIRRHLFDETSVPRAHTTIRGYWKHGRAGAGADDT